jgi:hypothetical protein
MLTLFYILLASALVIALIELEPDDTRPPAPPSPPPGGDETEQSWAGASRGRWISKSGREP